MGHVSAVAQEQVDGAVAQEQVEDGEEWMLGSVKVKRTRAD